MAIAYRPDVDGLRAVAIVPVVAFHAFPEWVPGGFVGVDVFFVISGYLIGALVFAQVAEGRFSLLAFWARRACRLLPALLLVLGAVLAAGWVLLLPDEYRMLGRHVRGGATYLSNFVLARESGYFDVAADAKPLLHLWSLAIEEQFYLVFPVVVVALVRWPRAVVPVVGMFLVGSFAYGVIDTARNPAAAYFLPQSRIWELLVGVMLAWWGGGLAGVAKLAAPLGLAAVLVPVAMLDRNSAFPGWLALAPVLGTALVIAAGGAAPLNRAVLAHRWLVGVGLVSYPLYLWHWPLLSMARIVAGGEVAPWLRAGLVVVAAGLAVATYRLVERPVRFGTQPRWRVAGILLILCAGIAALGQTAQAGFIRPYASRFGVDRVLEAAGEWDYPGPMERLLASGRVMWRAAGSGGAVLFVGDSNIEQYAPRMVALTRAAPERHKTALFLTGGGCVPIPVVVEPKLPGCRTLVEAAIVAAESQGVDTVVVGAQWWGYFSAPHYLVDGRGMTDAAAKAAALESLGTMLRRLRQGGRRVVVVLNIPWGAELDPRQGVTRGLLSFGLRTRDVPRVRLETQFGAISRAIAAVALAAGAEVVDPLDTLCDDVACPAADTDGMPIYKDAVHLRPRYVRSAVTYLDHVLRR